MTGKVQVEVEQGDVLSLNNPKIGLFFEDTRKTYGVCLKKEHTLQELREVAQSLITVIDQEIMKEQFCVKVKLPG